MITALRDLKSCHNIVITPFNDHVSSVSPSLRELRALGRQEGERSPWAKIAREGFLAAVYEICKIRIGRKG